MSSYVIDVPGTRRALCIKYGVKAAAWTVSVQVPSVLPRCLAQVDVSCISYMTTLLFLVLDEKTTQLERTHKLSTAMKKAWGNSCCQFSESYADGLTHSGESGYWHIQPIQWVHTP